MSLPRRTLPGTGMDLSVLGYGMWAVDDVEVDAVVAELYDALDHGVNWIDTGCAYGFGFTEEVVGTALRGLPAADRPLVFTKCGMVWDGEHPDRPPARIGAPASLRAEVEGSLRRLGVETLDYIQPQWPAQDGTPIEESWEALLSLKKEGKVRAVGLSNHYAQALTAAATVGHVDGIELPFSLINRVAAGAEFPWAVEHKCGVLAYGALAGGLFGSASRTSGVAGLPEDDVRRTDPEFTANLVRNEALIQALTPIAEGLGTSVTVLALGWVLAWDPVTAVVIGARPPNHVRSPRRPGRPARWARVAEVPLTGEVLDAVAAALREAGAGAGPVRP